MDWKKLGQAYKNEVFDRIPKEWQVENIPLPSAQPTITNSIIQCQLSQHELIITESSATDIVSKTSSGLWTAVEVATAFCHRAAIAHQLNNCLHEIFFDIAIKDAETADQYLKDHGIPKGPLHGLPVSLKDQFHVRGVETSMGYIGWLGTFQGRKGDGRYKNFESELVKQLRSLGAILYCKTSLAHAVMSGDTANNIIGTTLNPKHRLLHPGASSGGEGALVGCRGSPLGFGTDMGGSVRNPAALNGLFGLRPSIGRLSYEGVANSHDGHPSMASVVGPLTHTVEDLRLIMSSLLDSKPWIHDPLVHEIPWRNDEYDAILHPPSPYKLAFGVLRNDGEVTPHPPVLRAIDSVINALEEQGHEIIDWNPPSPITHPELADMAFKAWSFDGGTDMWRDFALSGEEPTSTWFFNLPELQGLRQANATEIMDFNVLVREAKKAYMEYWNSSSLRTRTGRPVDAIICPTMPYAGVKIGELDYLKYTCFVNVLDYTSIVVPVAVVDKDIDRKAAHFEGWSEADVKEQQKYDPDLFHGMPVSVQLIGRRLQEERVVALAKVVSEAMQT